MKKKIETPVFENIYELINDVKSTVKKIRGAASNIFSCDVLYTIKQITDQFRQSVNYPVEVTTDIFDKTATKVSIRPTELATIMDNLLQNAVQALSGIAEPKININIKNFY